MGINYLITLLYSRPRPFMLHDITLLIEKAPSASFPSDTTTIAFAAASAIWLIYRKLGWGILVVAVLVAVSRIFVGHHYPTDVFAGSVIGLCSTFICWQLYETINRKLSDEKMKNIS
ncbi:phosphatase PAP2 family protein [Virgibacillus necropolis]|uniref:phosphatase PAP2 family protein n=1 Tax=Virgibacillus necropolis TaxID=163877 RepID=UPI0038513681